eukprot:2245267-Rhodomonas_salina.4
MTFCPLMLSSLSLKFSSFSSARSSWYRHLTPQYNLLRSARVARYPRQYCAFRRPIHSSVPDILQRSVPGIAYCTRARSRA